MRLITWIIRQWVQWRCNHQYDLTDTGVSVTEGRLTVTGDILTCRLCDYATTTNLRFQH